MESSNQFYKELMEMTKIIDIYSPETFWQCEDTFKSIDRARINQWAIHELEKYRQDIHYETTDLSDYDIQVCHNDHFRLVISALERFPKYLYLYPQDYLCRNIGYKNIAYDRYAPDRLIEPDILDPDTALTFEEAAALPPNSTMRRYGLKDVIDYKPDDSETGLILRLLAPSTSAYEWSFSRDTFKPWHMISADPIGSHLVSLLTLVSVIDDENSIDTVRECTKHPFHHVRWSAVKSLCSLNADEGLSVVERLAASDPHPEVRKAANLTIEMNS